MLGVSHKTSIRTRAGSDGESEPTARLDKIAGPAATGSDVRTASTTAPPGAKALDDRTHAWPTPKAPGSQPSPSMTASIPPLPPSAAEVAAAAGRALPTGLVAPEATELAETLPQAEVEPEFEAAVPRQVGVALPTPPSHRSAPLLDADPDPAGAVVSTGVGGSSSYADLGGSTFPSGSPARKVLMVLLIAVVGAGVVTLQGDPDPALTVAESPGNLSSQPEAEPRAEPRPEVATDGFESGVLDDPLPEISPEPLLGTDANFLADAETSRDRSPEPAPSTTSTPSTSTSTSAPSTEASSTTGADTEPASPPDDDGASITVAEAESTDGATGAEETGSTDTAADGRSTDTAGGTDTTVTTDSTAESTTIEQSPQETATETTMAESTTTEQELEETATETTVAESTTTTEAASTDGQNGWVDSGNGVLLPPVLLQIRSCESTDNYTAANPRSSARGAYQFLTGSWAAYGHRDRYGVNQAHLATPAQQDEAALITWQEDGTRPWNASRNCWG